MNPTDPLAGLQPLRAPELINWWPLAPGWWVLLVLVLTSIAIASFLLYRRYQANAYRRLAAQQQQQLHSAWLSNNNSRAFIAQTNALLKSVALRAFPQKDVAAKNGSEWIVFLNQTQSASANLERFPEAFSTAAYTSDISAVNCDQLDKCALDWIAHHRVTP